jgi:hypothetical protein
MKKLFFTTIIALSLIVSTSYSQTFTVTRDSPSPIYVSIDSSADITSHFSINNQSSSTITLRLIRINVNLPSGWYTAMCDEHLCYSPTVDSTPWQTYSPGLHTTLSAHFYCNNTPGSGCITIKVVMQNSSESHTADFCAVVWPVGIKPISTNATEFKLEQNYPNPFNPSTKINFSIPKSDYVDLRVYDILGREVAVLVSGYSQAGVYEVEWDARNFASGMYYYRLKTQDNVSVKKMSLVK